MRAASLWSLRNSFAYLIVTQTVIAAHTASGNTFSTCDVFITFSFSCLTSCLGDIPVFYHHGTLLVRWIFSNHACNSAAWINASVDSKCCWRYSFPCLTTPLTVDVRHNDCVRSEEQTDTQTSNWLLTPFTFILPYGNRCGQNRVVFSAPIYCSSALC
jgi:hypothetical protein